MIAATLALLVALADPAQADVADLHSVTGPELPPAAPPSVVWPWIVISVLLGVGLAGWLLARRLRRPAAEPSADVWAARELAYLADADWSNPETTRRFAATLRGFLHRCVPAARDSQTTNELIGRLAANGFPPELVERWQNLLDRCDLANFARTGFDGGESAEALRCAQTLLPASLPKSETATIGQTGEVR